PGPPDLTAVQLQQPQHRSHGGGLAGAVGTEEPDQLAGAHAEGEVVQGDDVAEGLAQTVELEHGDDPSPRRHARALGSAPRPGGFPRAANSPVDGFAWYAGRMTARSACA